MRFEKDKLPSNKKFGFFIGILTLCLSCYFYLINSIPLAYIFFFSSLILLLIAYFFPLFFLPINKVWMRLGLLIGMIINPLIMGIIYFLMITPLALFLRALGRDELRLKKKEIKTYWIDREINKDDPYTFKKQF